MNLNPEKCHQLLNTKEQTTLKIRNLHIKNSLCEKLFGINYDYKLNFLKHIEDIFQRVSRKLNSLVRLASYMSSSKKCMLMLSSGRNLTVVP